MMLDPKLQQAIVIPLDKEGRPAGPDAEEGLRELRRLHDAIPDGDIPIDPSDGWPPPAGPIRGLTALEAAAKDFFDDANLTSQQFRVMMKQVEASVWWKAIMKG